MGKSLLPPGLLPTHLRPILGVYGGVGFSRDLETGRHHRISPGQASLPPPTPSPPSFPRAQQETLLPPPFPSPTAPTLCPPFGVATPGWPPLGLDTGKMPRPCHAATLAPAKRRHVTGWRGWRQRTTPTGGAEQLPRQHPCRHRCGNGGRSRPCAAVSAPPAPSGSPTGPTGPQPWNWRKGGEAADLASPGTHRFPDRQVGKAARETQSWWS